MTKLELPFNSLPIGMEFYFGGEDTRYRKVNVREAVALNGTGAGGQYDFFHATVLRAEDPAAPLARTAHANLRAQVAAEIEQAETLQPKAVPRWRLTDSSVLMCDGYPLLEMHRYASRVDLDRADTLRARIVDLLNTHGEG